MTEKEIQTEEKVEEQPVEQQETAQEVAEQKKALPEEPKRTVDHNWQEARELIRLQKQRIEELEHVQRKPQVEEKDEFADLDPEDYITTAKAKELAKKLAAREAKEVAGRMLQEYQQQTTLERDEEKMRNKYDDYDYVLENFTLPQIKNDPALAYKIQNSKNPAEVAYKLGKLSENYEDRMKPQETSPKAEKILKNSSRPVSSATTGHSLKSQADNFSNLTKAQIWEMSQKYAKQA